MTYKLNDTALEEEIRRLKRNMVLLDHLMRENQRGSLEDCLHLIEFAARDAARRLRQIARER